MSCRRSSAKTQFLLNKSLEPHDDRLVDFCEAIPEYDRLKKRITYVIAAEYDDEHVTTMSDKDLFTNMGAVCFSWIKWDDLLLGFIEINRIKGISPCRLKTKFPQLRAMWIGLPVSDDSNDPQRYYSIGWLQKNGKLEIRHRYTKVVCDYLSIPQNEI